MNRFIKTILCSVFLLGSVQQSCNAESIGLPLVAAAGIVTGIIMTKTRKGQAISASARHAVARFGKGLLQLPKNTYLRKGALGIALVYGTYLIIKNVKEIKTAVNDTAQSSRTTVNLVRIMQNRLENLENELRRLQPAVQNQNPAENPAVQQPVVEQPVVEQPRCTVCNNERIRLLNPCTANHGPFICRTCIQSLHPSAPHANNHYNAIIQCPLCRNNITEQARQMGNQNREPLRTYNDPFYADNY